MAHLRSQIISVVKEALENESIKAFDSIYKAIDNDEMPCAYVSINKIDNELVGISDLAVQRDYLVSVTIFHGDSEGVDEVIDDLLVRSEKAIINHPKLNDKTHQLSIDIESTDKGENILKVVNSLYTVTVFTSIDGSDQELN